MRLVNPEIRQPRCPDKPVAAAVVVVVAVAAEAEVVAAVAVAAVAVGVACEPPYGPATAARLLTIGCRAGSSSIDSTTRQARHDLQQRLGPDRVLPQERFVVRENEKDGCGDAGCKNSQADG